MDKFKLYKIAFLKSLIGIAILVVGIIICAITSKNGPEVLILISWFLIGIGICFTALPYMKAKDIIKTTCDNCHASLKGASYDFQLESEEYLDSNAQGQVKKKYIYAVHCKCPKCGEDKDFKESFVVASNVNPEVQVRKRLRSLFKD